MRRVGGRNQSTMLFYYRTNPLVDWRRDDPSDADASVPPRRADDDPAPYCRVDRPPSRLTEYVYQERRPFCPACMHDTAQTPFCGGAVCDTIRSELEIEQRWLAVADGSDTDDRDEFGTVDEWDEYGTT